MFLDQKVSAVLMPDVVEGADVRMIQRADRSCLALEALAERRIAADVRRKDLDCDGAIEARVFGFVDLPHPTGTDGSDDFVHTETGAGGQHGHVTSCRKSGWKNQLWRKPRQIVTDWH